MFTNEEPTSSMPTREELNLESTNRRNTVDKRYVYGETPTEVLLNTVHTVLFYKLPDIKVGTTKDPVRRHYQNRIRHGDDIVMHALEVFTGTITEIANREVWWAEEHGFEIQPHERYDSLASLKMMFRRHHNTGKLPWQMPQTINHPASVELWMRLPEAVDIYNTNVGCNSSTFRRLCIESGLPNTTYGNIHLWLSGEYDGKGGIDHLMSEWTVWKDSGFPLSVDTDDSDDSESIFTLAP